MSSSKMVADTTEHEKSRMKETASDTDHAPGSSPRSSSFERGLLGKKSPGVLRIEAISAHFTFRDRVLVFLGVFLIAYAYGLDGIVRYTYQVSREDNLSS